MVQPRLSILIVNWNSKEYVRRCLATVRETCTGLVHQIVVVDGGSHDGCGEVLAAEFPEAEFVQSDENIGFGRSNNLGFERISGDVLLLLNPDTELTPGAVQQLLDELERRSDAGILGPRLLNTDGSLQRSSVMALPTPLNQALQSELLMRLLPNSRLWGTGVAYTSAAPTAVEAVSGACMLMHTRVFKQLGGFRAEYFMYAEDTDLCARVRRLNLVVYHVPASEVIHHGGGSSRAQVSQFSVVMKRIANDTYMRLNHGPAAAFRYRLFQAISAISRIAVLVPASLLPGRHRADAVVSIQRWMHVLNWALGRSPLRA